MEISFHANYQSGQSLLNTLLPGGPRNLTTCSQSSSEKQLSKPKGIKSLPLCLAANSRSGQFKLFLQAFKFTKIMKEAQRLWGLTLLLCRHGTEKYLQSDGGPECHLSAGHMLPLSKGCSWRKDASMVKSSSPKYLLRRLKVSTPTQHGQVAPILLVHIHLIMGRYSN